MELKQKIMGRTRTFTVLTFTLGLFLAMVSCQNELLPVPTGIKEQTSREAAPEHFVASHGRQKIHLSWSPVAGAQGYRIYASDLMTPTEESFAQVTYVIQSETPVAEIDVKPGSEAWYRVSAILSNGAETVASKSLRATSLATPEITDIQTDSDDATVLTVYWNMSNCRDDTYRKQTEYTITCISPSDTISRTVKATQLQETCFTVDGLMAHTSYSCKITARTEFGDESESSEISAETLHQLQPQAALSLDASQGNDKNGITLRFRLPEKADLQRKDDGTFEKAPIKFTVYRKALGDESWVKVSENPELKKSDGSALTASEYPDDGGLEVSWKDTDVPQRGLIYEYKLQSFVDLAKFMTEHNIANLAALKASYNYIETSSTVSSTTTSGWRMAQPKLSTRDYEATQSEIEPGIYSSASLGFSFSWNNFLLESSVANANLAAGYKFLLYETMKPFDCDKPGKTERTCMVKSFPSIAAVNEHIQTFNLAGGASGARGMYSYTVYIVSESAPVPETGSTTLPADSYDNIESTPQIAVSDNAETIEDFEVRGGYKDKFIISWKKQSGTKYSLTYTESVNGVTSNVEVLSDSEVSEFTDLITSPSGSHGIERIYRLTATAGSSSAPISETRFAYSLGYPEPKFDSSNPYYDTITVRWEDVQGAESYKVQLDDDAPVEITTEGENANARISTDALGNKVYSYTFTEDQLGSRCRAASISGTDIAVKVSATSVVDDTTCGSVSAKTLGPAKVELETSVAQYYKSISVTWNKIDGAKAYQILRKRYTTNGSGGWRPDEDEWETFTFDPQTGNVLSNGEPYSPMTVTQGVKKDNGKEVYTLKDSHVDIPAADKGSAGQIAITQSRIPWGIPIEYMVIPLRSTGDSFDGTKLSSSTLTVEGKKLSYTGLVSGSDFIKKGSAIGYGLDVHAAKAESSSAIQIKWTKPYTEGKNVKPLIYRRLKSSSAIYTKDQIVGGSLLGLNTNTTEIQQPCSTNEERTKPFEYAVKYITNSGDSDSSQTVEQNSPFVESYTDMLSEIPDTNGEPLAVGYLFHIPQFTVNNVSNSDGSEGFTESVNWTDWNYTERKNGPEDLDGKPAYTVWAKNKNNSSGWFQIASITQNGAVSITQDPGWYETDIDRSATGLTLTPKNVNDSTGTNDGLLKVQRDYRHYYMIRAQRKNSAGNTIYTYIGLDENVWTYRRISAEEFAKCITLILADAINQSGIDSGGNRAIGNFRIKHPGASKTLIYGTPDGLYTHIFHDVPGRRNQEMASSFTISFPDTESRSAADGNKAYYFPKATITVSHNNGNGLSLKSYNGTLAFTAGEIGRNGLTVLSDGVTTSWIASAEATLNSGVNATSSVSSSNETEFKKLFPFGLGQDHKDGFSTYNENYPTYQNSWWTERSNGQESSTFTEAE